jgi:tetratricopeptide (TPR) repeat protein
LKTVLIHLKFTACWQRNIQTSNKLEAAIKHYKLALEIYPEDEIAIYNIALCFDSLGKVEQAIAYFNQFIDQHPYSELAWYHLGITYSKDEQFEKAITALEYSLLVDEYFVASYYEIARISRTAGKL